jgi:hypothetical protein
LTPARRQGMFDVRPSGSVLLTMTPFVPWTALVMRFISDGGAMISCAPSAPPHPLRPSPQCPSAFPTDSQFQPPRPPSPSLSLSLSLSLSVARSPGGVARSLLRGTPTRRRCGKSLLGFGFQAEAAERRHRTVRERTVTPTLHTLQDPILLLPCGLLSSCGFPNPTSRSSLVCAHSRCRAGLSLTLRMEHCLSLSHLEDGALSLSLSP